MKRIILFLLVVIILSSLANAGEIIDYQDTDTGGNAFNAGGSATFRYAATTIRPTQSYTTQTVAIALKRVGSPTYSLSLRLYGSSDGMSPDPTLIYLQSTNSINSTTVSNSAYVFYNFTFNATYPLVSATTYDVVAVATAGGGDGSNFLSWSLNYDSGPANTCDYWSADGTTWNLAYCPSPYRSQGWYRVYNYSVAAGIPVTSTPSFIAPTPHDNEHNNTQPTINCTHPSADVTFSLYVNNTLIYDNVVGNYSYGVSFTPTLIEGNITYACIVKNTSNNVYSTNISRSFIYDSIMPFIDLKANQTIKSNGTKIANHKSNLTLQIEFSINTH